MIHISRLLIWAALLISVFSLGLAQETTGTISGAVKDESGAVLPGVSIGARNLEMGLTRATLSDDQGRYRLPQLRPGPYELKAELAGFQTTSLRGITLNLTQEAVVNISLKVGQMQEEVVVSAEVPLVETMTATVSALVDEKTIRELPLNGRDFVQLAALQEGVVTPTSGNRGRTGDAGVKMSVGGTRPNQTAVLLDGSDIKNFYGGTPGGLSGGLLGVDTVREFKVITNAYSAEYGRFTGGVVSAITRSGTNDIHGTLFEFLRNSALDARNFFDPGANPPPFKRNQFGFTFGGPVKKDRTFYFGSYEALRQRLTTTSISIFPNADAHRGILPGRAPTAVPANVRPYLDLFPLPNGRDYGDGTGQFIFSNPQPTDEDYFVIKLDHQLSSSNTFFVRYTFDDSSKTALNEGFIGGVISASRNQYVTLEERKIFSPQVLNEFRFALNRSTASDDDFENIPVPRSLWFRPERTAMGLIQIQGGISQFGTTTRTPQSHVQNLFQYMDNVVWSRGRHSVKIGAAFDRFQFNLQNLARFSGSFQFRNLADFLRGASNQAQLFYSEPFRAGLRESMIGLYIQDDVQLSGRLTANLGLRYEFITSPSEVAGRLGNLHNPYQVEPTIGNPYIPNPSLKAFSPRLGFAWDPTGSGKSSIRGGFGLFYDHILPWVYNAAPHRMKPFAIQASLESPRVFVFPDALRQIAPNDPAVLRPNVFVVVDPKLSYVMQWNLSVQREMISGMALTLTYSGSRGVHLSRTVDANTPLPTLVNGRPFFPTGSARHNPGYTQILTRFWDANSYYNGLKVGLRTRLRAGFQYQLSYQWQKFMDDGSNIGGSPGDFGTSNVNSMNPLDHVADRGLSAYHTAHSFSSNFTLDLPFGPGRRYGAGLTGFAGKMLEGWQLSGIVQLASGPPANIEGDGTATCEVCLSRPNLVAGRSNNPQTGDINRWFDISSFEMQPTGFYGNAGRNTGIGPGLASFDASIHKSFSMGEKAAVQFRAELFNVLNRANFGSPLRTRTAFSRGVASGSFGQILETTTSARQVQFGLKVLF